MSKPHPRSKLFAATTIIKKINKMLNKYIPQEVQQLIRIQQKWPDMVGALLYPQTWPVSLTKSVLVIHGSDPQWLHELGYLRQELLTNIHKIVPAVVRLQPRLGQVPDRDIRAHWQSSLEEQPTAVYRPVLTEVPESETIQAMASVRDVELKHAIAAARLMLGKR